MAEKAVARFGVHSEVGKLRTVMVCRPGLAHQRLTPGNRADLLFDDVLWVHEAQKDHYDFVLKMRERGVDVVDLHDLLADVLADPAARAWVLDRRITPNDVGDVMPIGKGIVLVGMGERTTRQAVFQVADELFRRGGATRVIACVMPKSRAAMHLDTVFSFCDRDLCTTFRDVADRIRCFSA